MAKIKKDPARKIVIATRITKPDYKILKAFCRQNRITQSRLLRYGLEQTLKNNSVPTTLSED